MRLGKPVRKSRGRQQRRSTPKPESPKGPAKYAWPHFVPGQVSSDLITSVYTPLLNEIAENILEEYSGEFLEYQEIVNEKKSEAKKIKEDDDEEEEEEETEEVQVDVDGTIESTLDLPDPPKRPVFDSRHSIDELNTMLSDTASHFNSNDWKIHANAAKFERELDEKYGIFRPFITEHPEVEQFIKGVQRRYAMGYFSPFRQGSGPISTTSSVVLLFMLQRQKLGMEFMILISLFLLVGLQPWALVAIVALGHHQLNRRKIKALGTMKSNIPNVEPYYKGMTDDQKKEMLTKPVGSPLTADDKLNAYDVVLIGTGPSTLYTAALLSRAGRKVIVLSSREDASGCANLSSADHKTNKIPFDLEDSNASNLKTLQEELAPALCTNADLQGGVRFAQIGSNVDGYAFEILSIPGMGGAYGKEQIPFVIGASIDQLAEDAANCLGDGLSTAFGSDSQSLQYAATCKAMNGSSFSYYLTKIFPENSKSFLDSGHYENATVRPTQPFLDKTFPLNPHLRSLFAGIGMKHEDIKPSQTSMGAHITNVSAALSGEGMHYPIGGPRALCHALASVVEQYGGRIATEVGAKEFVFEDVKEAASSKKDPDAPRCTGIKLGDNRTIKVAKPVVEKGKEGEGAIICMDGFIYTFLHLMPGEIRDKYKVPRGLPVLTESRPVIKFLFAVKGSAEELNVTGADYYRLPSAALPEDEVGEGGLITCGEIGGSGYDEDESPKDTTHRGKTSKKDEKEDEEKEVKEEDAQDVTGIEESKKTKQKVKFNTGSSWIHISFPSAKDPSFSTCYGNNVTTCVVTIEADDDFVTLFETKPRLFAIHPEKLVKGDKMTGECSRLLERVMKDLAETFPQVTGKILASEIRGPYRRGLTHNPERFAAKGIRADTPYPGLYVGGADLTVNSFSDSIVGGWLAANAVMGYSVIDHQYLEKSITSDLAQFLEEPYELEEDLAVPYYDPPEPAAEGTNDDN